MTKYRVISRVRSIDDEARTLYYPQRKALLGWKNIKQDGDVVKFPNIYEALKYVDADPLAVNVEQPPAKLNDQLNCWIFHSSARTTKEDLHEFLRPVLEDFVVSKHEGQMFIALQVSTFASFHLPVHPGDCVVLYPNGRVYVVPDVDNFPVSVL